MIVSFSMRNEFLKLLNSTILGGDKKIKFYDAGGIKLAEANFSSSSPIASYGSDGDGACVGFFDVTGTNLKAGVNVDGKANRFEITDGLTNVLIEGSIGDKPDGPEDIKFNNLDWVRGDYISITELSIKIKPGTATYVH
jgi:hypothetical protein